MTELEKKLWKRTNWVVRVLRIVPFVSMVAVCNNLAFAKVDAKSDIDLFIVAKKGHMFTVRFFTVIILQILGVRMHGDKVSGRFCLSFFIDESHLNLRPIAISEDIYLAFWIKSLIPLIDNGVSEEFLEENFWAERFFENKSDFVMDRSKVLKKSWFTAVPRAMLWFLFGDWFESLIGRWQLARARWKSAPYDDGVVVGENILKFHHHDRRTYYRDQFFDKFGKDAKVVQDNFLQI